jgi:ribose/xylose/arabinose/galactoside ABC-type transport system permease subunit
MNLLTNPVVRVTLQKGIRSVTKQTAFLAILVMLFIMTFSGTNFYSTYNILDLFSSASILVILAFGVTFPVMCGGCDLSVGGTLCISGIVAIKCVNFMPIPLAILCAVLIGALIGFINGFLVVYQRTEPFIITLGMDMLLKGISQQLTDAHPVTTSNPNFMMIANGNVFGIPNLILILALVFAGMHYIMRYTQFGRNCYAIGGDYEVAVYSGIPVVKSKWLAFVISGAVAAFAGVLLSSRLNTGSSTYGQTTALVVNCGVVIGGTSFAGGIGGIPQSGIGMMVFAVLENCMNMLGIDAYIQQIFKGMVITMIIWLDCFGRKRKREDLGPVRFSKTERQVVKIKSTSG